MLKELVTIFGFNTPEAASPIPNNIPSPKFIIGSSF